MSQSVPCPLEPTLPDLPDTLIEELHEDDATCPNGAAPPDRDRLTPRANARDLSVCASVTRAPTVTFGPSARTRIVLRRRGVVGGRRISLLFLKRRNVGWLRLAVSDRSLRNSEALVALRACTCSETGSTYQAASLRCR